MPRVFRYLLLDVFTDTLLAGNQLAVFPEAHGLSVAEMQALARETNLSETTFCFPPEGLSSDAAERDGVPVRIFTTAEELPFAGHPTLGTATALRAVLPALRGAATVRLALKAGIVPVRFMGIADEPAGPDRSFVSPDALPFGRAFRGAMEQPPPEFGAVIEDRAAVAAALGLQPDALHPGRPVQTVSTGLPFAVVPVRSVAALAGMRLVPHLAEDCLAGTGARFFYAVAPEDGCVDGTRWRTRMQFYNGEDPATGSAAGCAAAYLVQHGYAPAAATLELRQGVEFGRPSLLLCSAQLAPVAVEDVQRDGTNGMAFRNQESERYVRVGGSTILVAEGRFFLG